MTRQPLLRDRRWFALLAVVLGLLSGCRTDVTVGIATRADGSGRVTVSAVLDREAVSQAGDLTALLRLDDLREAGWQVVGPAPLPPGGRVEFRAEKAVASPDEAEAVLRQVSGDRGPFANLRVTRTRNPVVVSSAISGTVDLSAGYEAFGDDLLAERLGTASRLGVDPAQLATRYAATLADLVPLHLKLQVPGATRTFDLASGEVTKVSLRARTWNTVLALPAGALLATGIGTAVVRRGRRPKRRPALPGVPAQHR